MKKLPTRQLIAVTLSLFLFVSILAPALSPRQILAESPHDLLPEADLSNVAMLPDGLELSEALKKQLAEDLFVVLEGSTSFTAVYEMGAYTQKPLFITADAMLHLYHLLFSHLLSTTEDGFLLARAKELSVLLQKSLQQQLEALRGSAFERAAQLNLAFASVGASLLDDSLAIPEDVSEVVKEELQLIREAKGLAVSPLFAPYLDPPPLEDYSQYKVRGDYTRRPETGDYFRALMWFGRRNFGNKNELTNRCGLLMSLALSQNPELLAVWDALYDVSALFAGSSDDLSFRDFLPLIEDAYGKEPTLKALTDQPEAWTPFHEACQKLRRPRIYSEVRERNDDPEKEAEEALGFRLLGQRFSADQDIFGQLIFDAVDLNSKGEARGLPDVLDVMAAFGSDLANDLLSEAGADDFERFPENLDKLRDTYADPEKLPAADNLAAAWLESLRPLLRDKRQNQDLPAFMRSERWARHDLECFAGSFTELKHDTILYSKQVMAEMGGIFEKNIDDRGYVQPEPELFRQLAALGRRSGETLKRLSMLSDTDDQLITDIVTLAERLAEISEKELRNELPSEDDFNFIRAFGGNLQGLSFRCLQRPGAPESDADKPAIVTDVATNPGVNEKAGGILELGLGNPQEIWVIVPVDGSLRLAYGAVYNFYQFVQPLDQRLSDEEWRDRIGADLKWDDQGNLIEADPAMIPEKPFWTQDYRQPYPRYKEQTALPFWGRLPFWAEGKSGQCTSQEGFSAHFGDGKAEILNPQGKRVWESPDNYWIQDLHFIDIDRSGRDDLLLLCWKKGRYGSYHPFG